MTTIIIFLVYYSGSSLLEQVLLSLKSALNSSADDISLSWELLPGLSASMLSPEHTVIFRGQMLIIYAQLTGTMPVSPYSCPFIYSVKHCISSFFLTQMFAWDFNKICHLPGPKAPILPILPSVYYPVLHDA